MPEVTPVARAYVLISDDGDDRGRGHHGKHAYLCIEDSAGNVFKYSIPHVLGIEYRTHVSRRGAEASLLLSRVLFEVRIPIGTSAPTTVEDLLSEIAATNLVESKS